MYTQRDKCEPRRVVGEVLEEKLMKMFNLKKYDNENKIGHPDLISKSGSFCIEAKSSSYLSGAIIKQRQLVKFKRTVKIRRFYAFGFHSIVNGDLFNYKSEDALKKDLDLKSLFLFPFSIVIAHYDNSEKRGLIDDGPYVQLTEADAEDIFYKEKRMWAKLNLDEGRYKHKELHEKVCLITNGGHLERELTESFNPEFL